MIDTARRFLALQRFALVGVSRNEKEFSRFLLRELVLRGYDVVPVSPVLDSVAGRACCARIQDIRPPVVGALVVTARERSETVARDCIASGVRMVWFHRGSGAGSGTEAAARLCRDAGIEVVTDLCPFMAMPGASWPHRLHRVLRRAVSLRAMATR